MSDPAWSFTSALNMLQNSIQLERVAEYLRTEMDLLKNPTTFFTNAEPVSPLKLRGKSYTATAEQLKMAKEIAAEMELSGSETLRVVCLVDMRVPNAGKEQYKRHVEYERDAVVKVANFVLSHSDMEHVGPLASEIAASAELLPQTAKILTKIPYNYATLLLKLVTGIVLNNPIKSQDISLWFDMLKNTKFLAGNAQVQALVTVNTLLMLGLDTAGCVVDPNRELPYDTITNSLTGNPVLAYFWSFVLYMRNSDDKNVLKFARAAEEGKVFDAMVAVYNELKEDEIYTAVMASFVLTCLPFVTINDTVSAAFRSIMTDAPNEYLEAFLTSEVLEEQMTLLRAKLPLEMSAFVNICCINKEYAMFQLRSLTTFATLEMPTNYDLDDEDLIVVAVDTAVEVGGVSLTIPQGTKAKIVPGTGKDIIVYLHKYCGWSLITELVDTVPFLLDLVALNPDERLISYVFNVLEQACRVRDYETLCRLARFLVKVAPTHTESVTTHLRRSALFDASKIGYAREVLSTENISGDYTFTLLLCELCSILNFSEASLHFAQVLSDYAYWKYVDAKQKYNIGCNVTLFLSQRDFQLTPDQCEPVVFALCSDSTPQRLLDASLKLVSSNTSLALRDKLYSKVPQLVEILAVSRNPKVVELLTTMVNWPVGTEQPSLLAHLGSSAQTLLQLLKHELVSSTYRFFTAVVAKQEGLSILFATGQDVTEMKETKLCNDTLLKLLVQEATKHSEDIDLLDAVASASNTWKINDQELFRVLSAKLSAPVDDCSIMARVCEILALHVFTAETISKLEIPISLFGKDEQLSRALSSLIIAYVTRKGEIDHVSVASQLLEQEDKESHIDLVFLLLSTYKGEYAVEQQDKLLRLLTPLTNNRQGIRSLLVVLEKCTKTSRSYYDLCQFVSKSMTHLISHISESLQDLLLVASLVKPLNKLLEDHKSFASMLTDNGTIKSLLNLYALEDYSDLSLSILLELCEIDVIAQVIVNSGLVYTLLESPVSQVIAQGGIRPSNKYHSIWSGGLLTMILLLSTKFDNEIASLFATHFSRQINFTIGSWSDSAVSLALCQETLQLILLSKVCELDLGSLNKILNRQLSHPKYLASKIVTTTMEEQREYLQDSSKFVAKVTAEIKQLTTYL